MTTLRRDNYNYGTSLSRRRPRRTLAVFASFLLLLAFLSWVRPIAASGVMRLALPVWYVRDAAAELLSPFSIWWVGLEEIQAENQTLREGRAILVLESEEKSRVIEQYEALLDFELEGGSHASGTMGAILLRPPRSPFDTIILSRGRTQGVREGDLVFAPGSMLLGAVREVYPETSKAVLYSSPGETVPGYLQDLGSVNLAGLGGGNFSFSVPRADAPQVGDLVFKEGTHIVLAEVGTTTITESEALALVRAYIPRAIHDIRWVHIRHE